MTRVRRLWFAALACFAVAVVFLAVAANSASPDVPFLVGMGLLVVAMVLLQVLRRLKRG